MRKPTSPVKKERRNFIPDTNVLWHETKDVEVSPEFSTFTANHCDDHNIMIVVPEVVFGELLFQHTSTGLDTLQKLERNVQSLSAITNYKYKNSANQDHVKKSIVKKLEGWLSGCGGTLIKTPVEEIDWKKMVSDSIWRVHPFTEDKKTKAEKGFRDALILETIISYAEKNQNSHIDFVSNDRILRDSVKARSKTKKLLTFESLSDYSSHLRLLDQKLTEEFVSAISDRANDKFLSKSGKSGLWIDEDIGRKTKEDYSEKLTPPPENKSTLGSLTLLSGMLAKIGPNWKAIDSESIFVWRPTFEKKEGTNTYWWASKFQFVQFFRNEGGPSTSIFSDHVSAGELRIRRVIFQANWK